jgi:hypothetical protein
MKRLSVVVLVLLLVGVVAYGYDPGNWEDNDSLPEAWTSGALGIGTDAPDEMIHVKAPYAKLYLESTQGGGSKWKFYPRYDGSLRIQDITAGTSRLMINSSGNVGIGTTSPTYVLDVISDTNSIHGRTTGDSTYGVYGDANGSGYGLLGSSTSGCAIYTYTPSGYAGYFVGPKSYFSGKVGIGTDDPQSELAVNGTITTKRVTVTETGWSDFVFADDYKLMPLSDLSHYIKANNSLPGIPTEKEVMKNGVDVGDMQAKFLEKIEELTLYMIELKKDNEEFRKTNEHLERRISALEK